MLLVTSIPPAIKRAHQAQEKDPSLFLDIRKSAIESWRKNGFDRIISCNTSEEAKSNTDLANFIYSQGIEQLVINSPAKSTNRFLPSLRECIRAAINLVGHAERINLINADIILDTHHEKLSSLLSRGKDCSFIAYRTPVETHLEAISKLKNSQKYFAKGIDFFSSMGSDLDKSIKGISKELSIGMPWWDIALALSLAMVTREINALPSDYFRHIEHKSRQYNSKSWAMAGQEACRSISILIKDCNGPTSQEWIKSLARTMQTEPTHTNMLVARIKSLLVKDISYKEAVDVYKLQSIARKAERILKSISEYN